MKGAFFAQYYFMRLVEKFAAGGTLSFSVSCFIYSALPSLRIDEVGGPAILVMLHGALPN
jgi:hypothetical protein